MHLRDYKSITGPTIKKTFSRPARAKTYFRRRDKFVLIALFLTLGLWMYVLIASPWFEIKNITVNGLETIEATEIISLLKQETQNIFRFSEKRAYKIINQIYFLDEIKLKKIYPHHLAVTIKEKYPQFEYQAPDYVYLLDSHGLVVERQTATGTRWRADLPQMISDEKKIYAVRDQLINPKKLEAVNFFIKYLVTEAAINIKKIIFTSAEEELITLETAEGFNILFSYKEDQAVQAFKVVTLLRSLRMEERANLLYINARFIDRVYYKFR